MGRGGALAAIPGAAIFSPIDEAASAAAAGIPETSMGARHGPRPPTGGGAPGAGTAALAAAGCGGGGRGRGRNCGAGGFPGWGARSRGGAAAGARGGGGTGGGPRTAPETPGLPAWAPLRCGAAPRRLVRDPGRRGCRGEQSSAGQVRGPGGEGRGGGPRERPGKNGVSA